jgi:hypothetical protein
MHRFEKYYQWNVWSGGDGSGSGSEKHFTKPLIGLLTSICETFEIQSVGDLPCGAGLWQNEWIMKLNTLGCTYEGVDVANTAIQRFKQRNPNVNIKHWDLTQPLDMKVDLVLCRDALQHIPLKDCVTILENLTTITNKLLLVGSYIDGYNEEIPIGSYFPIDLAKKPFDLQPDWILPELHDFTQRKKYLYIYTKKTLSKIDWTLVRESVQRNT